MKQNTTCDKHPDLSIIRAILFWDTKMDKLDWQKQKKAIIKRVFERGNDIEKNEITRFYGSEVISEVLSNSKANCSHIAYRDMRYKE